MNYHISLGNVLNFVVKIKIMSIVLNALVSKFLEIRNDWYSFQAVVISILLYGCTTWTLTKRLEKKLDGNYTRMPQLYGQLPPITKTIQVRRTRHAGHCWRSRDELISDVLLWTSKYGRAKAGWPARTYIQQLCEDKGWSPEDLPEVMNDREKWRERVRDIRAGGMTWWWLWFTFLRQLHRQSPVGWWGRTIHRLHICTEVKAPNTCSGYDTIQSDGEAPILEPWGMKSTPSLALLPGPFWLGVVASDRVLSMDQIELFDI